MARPVTWTVREAPTPANRCERVSYRARPPADAGQARLRRGRAPGIRFAAQPYRRGDTVTSG